MKTIARVLGPILIVAGVAACGSSMKSANVAREPRSECRAGGASCRWDNQCCSGRCYVDTGCSG